MPYAIRRAKGKYEVYKEADGEVMGTFNTRFEARQQMRAIYAKEGDKSAKTAQKVMGEGDSEAGGAWVPEEDGSAKAMVCPGCGETITIEALFCPFCGMELPDEEEGEEPIEKEPAGEKALNLTYVKSLGLQIPAKKLSKLVAVKFVSPNTIQGYTNLWGDPSKVDLEREFFTSETDFWDGVLKSAPRPLTWDHAQDDSFKADPIIGTITDMGDDKVGRWYVAQLQKSHEYRKAIDGLIEEGKLGTSSDSAPQYVQREKAKSGAVWLKRWPLFAAALTTTPCEPRMMGSVEYFKSIGLSLPSPEASGEQVRAMVQSAKRMFEQVETFEGGY